MTPTTQRALLTAVPVVGAAVFRAAETRLETDPLIEGAILVGITIAATMVSAVLSAGLSMWNRLVGFLVMAWFVVTLLWFWGFFLADVGMPRLITTAERDAMFGWLAVGWVAWIGAEVVLWFRHRRKERGEDETEQHDEEETNSGEVVNPRRIPTSEWVQTGPHTFHRPDIAERDGLEPFDGEDTGMDIAPKDVAEPETGRRRRTVIVPDDWERPSERYARAWYELGGGDTEETPALADDDVLGHLAAAWPERRRTGSGAVHLDDMESLTGFPRDEVDAALADAGIVPERVQARSLTSGESTRRLGVAWADLEAVTGPEGVRHVRHARAT